MDFSQTIQGQSVSNSETVHQDSVPDELSSCLFQYAHRNSWSFISLQDLLARTDTLSQTHVFLQDGVRKAQNLNFIFEQVGHMLGEDRYFAFKIVTAENSKFSIRENLHWLVFFLYYPFHFLVRRVLPKLKGFRKLCRLLGTPVDISKAEIIGRLIYKGFELIDVIETNRETILITKRNIACNPSLEKPTPSEGFLFRMERMGLHAKPIKIYKLRSMHPYAEYVQAYLHQNNGLEKGGKFKNDFRISTGGKIIRKYWLDEIPMIYNLLKGDLKFIGVRPISEHYFSLYPADAQAMRVKYKPGLLPPFYADLPQTFEEIVQSEMNYLKAYEQDPFKTDLRYFGRILVNIIFKNARSR